MYCLILTTFLELGSGVTAYPMLVLSCHETEQACKSKLYEQVEYGRKIIKLNNGGVVALEYYPGTKNVSTTINCAESVNS